MVGPKVEWSKFWLGAVPIIVIAGLFFLIERKPAVSPDTDVARVSPGVQPAIIVTAQPPAPARLPTTPRPPATIPPRNAQPPEPARSSVRLTRDWRTVSLGPDRDRTSISIEGDGPFRIRAGGKLYAVNGSASVQLDLRGLSEVDLRAVAGPVTVDLVASRNRSLVDN